MAAFLIFAFTLPGTGDQQFAGVYFYWINRIEQD
jgi:hypothetical protein